MTKQTLTYLKSGHQLGKYEIKELVGRGGMAEVYRAYNPDLKNDVAIKVLNPNLTESHEASERFRREAQAIASLNHPNIVRVFDFSVDGNLHYMVMELLEGETLGHVIERYPEGMPYDQIVDYFTQLGSAIGYAHQQGVVHRDIKPSNVIITKDGTRVVLTDFGLAKIVGQAGLTMSGMSSGTPSYMAPEQAAGEEITARTDIYSLGVVLFEMATGTVPFKGESFANILIKHIKEAPPRPSSVSETINPVLEPVILRAMAKDPDLRYPTVEEMVVELSGTPEELSGDTIQISTELIAQGLKSYDEDVETLLQIPTAPSLPVEQPAREWFPWWMTAGVIGLMIMAGAGLIFLNSNNDTADDTDPVSDVAEVDAPEGMVYVEEGSFRMGAADGGSDARPPHQVSVPAFYIDVYEVTNADYMTFLEKTGYPEEPSTWTRAEASVWEITGSDLYVMGNHTDRWSTDGSLAVAVENAMLDAQLDADNNTGLIIVEFDGTIEPIEDIEFTGHIRIEHQVFDAQLNFHEGGVGDHVRMHGDTGQEGPGLPSLIAPVATWGTASLFVDDNLQLDELGAHFMLVKGVRDEQLRILKADGTCCYSSANPADGLIDEDRVQVEFFLFKGSAGGTYDSGGVPGNAVNEQNVWLNLHFNNAEVVKGPSNTIATFAPDTDNHPVTGISWDAAQAYCAWLDKRLPTEAEWEYTARGPRSLSFPWGNSQTVDGRIPANVEDGEIGAVGQFEDGQSPFGVYDMAGNAWEWVNDWYDPNYYAESPGENPTGPSSGDSRVVRGGGPFRLDPVGVTEFNASFRRNVIPDTQSPEIGFRCASDYFDLGS